MNGSSGSTATMAIGMANVSSARTCAFVRGGAASLLASVSRAGASMLFGPHAEEAGRAVRDEQHQQDVEEHVLQRGIPQHRGQLLDHAAENAAQDRAADAAEPADGGGDDDDRHH